MKHLIWIVLLVFVAGMANGIMDDLSFHFEDTVFADFDPQKWDPNYSWENKNQFSDYPILNWLMRNVFTSLTDWWHFFKEVMISCLVLATFLASFYIWTAKNRNWTAYSISIVLLRLIFAAGFHLTYTFL